jgi:hypothetical protein
LILETNWLNFRTSRSLAVPKIFLKTDFTDPIIWLNKAYLRQERLARRASDKRSKLGDRQACVKAIKKIEQAANSDHTNISQWSC